MHGCLHASSAPHHIEHPLCAHNLHPCSRCRGFSIHTCCSSRSYWLHLAIVGATDWHPAAPHLHTLAITHTPPPSPHHVAPIFTVLQISLTTASVGMWTSTYRTLQIGCTTNPCRRPAFAVSGMPICIEVCKEQKKFHDMLRSFARATDNHMLNGSAHELQNHNTQTMMRIVFTFVGRFCGRMR